ncbi:hypothetical protein D3C81_1736860 [compost metagenome]
MLLEEDFHVGAVAAQQRHVVRQAGEAHFDVDGARLLLQFADEGRDARDFAFEAALTEGIQGDAHRHARTHAGGVDFVDRRFDIQALVVDQVHRRRSRDTRR